MAVDGRKLGDSVYKGSDDFHSFPCSPCSKEGKNVAAVIHCVDCDENLCTSCVNHHNKFSAMKGHQMLDKLQQSNVQRPQLLSQRCTKHGGRLIDVYCPNHDTVCCSTCVAIEHSICRGIQFIPDVAKDVRKRKDLQDLQSKMTSLESRLSTLLKKKHIDLRKLIQNKDEILKDIRVLRKKINDHLDKIEQEIIDETTIIFEGEMQNVEADEKKLEMVLAELSKSQQQLKAAKDETDSEVFVQMKTTNTGVNKLQDAVDKMEQCGYVPDFKIKFDRTFERFQDEIGVLGKLTELSPNISMTMQREYECRVNDDDNRCNKIQGICLTTKGNILMTDMLNKKLKQINCTDNLVFYLNMPGSPFGICQIFDDQFAVTLLYEKKIQFVKVDEQMRLLNSFDVGDRCRGVSYSNGVIFVCCGGWKMKSTEGPGHIELYNEEGVLLRSYFESIGCPSGLAFSSNGKEMWIADRYNGFIVMDINGYLLSKNTFEGIQEPAAICKLCDDIVCINGYKSGDLVTIVDGNVKQILLTNTVGILAMCFDEKRSQLIIHIYGHEKIKVFEVYRQKT